ncbi:MAG TPA: hypothetical protein VEJ16_08720 [Alphaproteobacteria bacterium]|nr:hypothetical protein [Alphaproteobacteria bacterium]
MDLRQIALLGAILLVCGCSIATEDLLPSLVGQEPSGKTQQTTTEDKSPPSAAAPSTPEKNQTPEPSASTSTGTPPADDRRPLVVIRFARPDVQYEQALYLAVSEALARKPDAGFDVVAVAPRKATAKSPFAVNESQKNADAVMRSLANMGLPAERVTLSATTSEAIDSNEVRVFVR